MVKHVLWHPVAKTYVRALDGSGAALTSQLGQARVFPTLEAAQHAAQVAYSDAHSRAVEAIFVRYQHNAKAFAEVVAQECFLTEAFLPPAKQRERLTFTLDPKRVEQQVQLQTEAATALHAIWKDFVAGKAQTVAEKSVGKYLAAIVNDAIEAEAEREAESEVEDLGRQGRL